MKRTLALLLALVMVLSLAACGSSKAPAASASPAADGSQTVSGKITYLTNRTDLDTDGTYAALIAKFNERKRCSGGQDHEHPAPCV